MEGNNPGNGKDRFYYSVSEYERKKNPNISNDEVAAKVEAYRVEPEKYYAMAYKEYSGGKTIDKKTLQRVSELDGMQLDPNRLSPSEINFVDNEKLDILTDYSKIQKISSDVDLPLDATDAEIEKHAIKRMQGRPINNYELEKQLAVDNLKKKMNELRETQKVYTDKISKTELTPIEVEDFFADARKKTNKTNIVKAVKDEGDFFSGNDAEEELTNANIESQKYIKVLEEQTKLRLNSIKDPKEKQIATAIISNKKPQVEDDFKPSQELDAFIKTYDTYKQQYNINATQFGSIIDNKKKTYNQQLAENRQKKQVEVDKNQKLITTNDALKIMTLPLGMAGMSGFLPSDKSPSIAKTWVNHAIEGLFGGAIDFGNAFYSNELEAKIKEAKKVGNTDEYLNLQRKLALVKFKENNDKMEQTLQRTDITQPLYEDRKIVNGFTIRVNSKGEYQGMIDIDGKIVHTLSPAQQKAVEDHEKNPKAYNVERGWSKGWYKSLGNSTAQTIVEMAPMIAGGVATAPLRGMGMLGAVTSKAVPMLPMFMSSYHDNFTEMFEKTGDWSTASVYGSQMASLEAIPEMLLGPESKAIRSLTGKGVTAEVVMTAGKRAADIVANSSNLYKQSFFKTFSKELAKDVGSEYAEEFFTLFSQSAVKNMYGEDGTVGLNEILTTLLVTPLATAPMSSITNISNYKNNTDFKTMILAGASDVDKTTELMTEAVYSNKNWLESKIGKGLGVSNFVNKINEEDVKKKLDLVKAVATRKDNYNDRSAGMNLSFTEEENGKLEDYMFEEAVGEINGKKVDYTKEVDAIIAAATKRAKIEAATEKNDEIIPVDDEIEEAEVIEEETEDIEVPSSERMKKPLRNIRPKMEPAPPKNKKGFRRINSMGPDGKYDTLYNTDTRSYIPQGEIALNFNITNDDATILAEEIQDIASMQGILVRLDIAKDDNNTDVPLLLSFENIEDAQKMHEVIANRSDYYKKMVPQKTDRILGKKIDEKVQFGVRNLKNISKAQDIIENSTKDEDGNYLYSNQGLEMIVSTDEYAQYEEILFAADKMWQSSTPSTPVQEVSQSPAPLNELRTLVSERMPQEPQTRTTDERGFERLNVKSDANLQDAFDYTDGDKKEIPVFSNGKKGILRVDEGGAMEFDNGTQIIEYGNINDQRTSTLSELGFTLPEDFKVKNGNIVIDGELYQNPYSSPDAAITRDEDGNIISVELEKREIRGGYNGIQVNDVLTPVTFTGQRAIDVATILMENELATNTKLREEFESFPAPDIQPSFVPNNVTVDQLGDILLDYFPDKPLLAMETAKIYFAQAIRMSTLFPQQYPTPAAYIIDKINKDTVKNITDIERLKAFLTNIINTTDNQDRIDFAQRALDNVNRINAIKVQTPQELITEITSKPLSHISLGPGLGMGQNEANGTYLSTETMGNRYELIKTPGAKIYSAKVNITNPYDLDANTDDINSLRNRNLPSAIQKYIADNKLEGSDKKQLESITNLDSDILESFAGFDQYIADAVTADLQSKGYDSLYSRQSVEKEGYLVVFNKDNVTLTEEKFVEKVITKKKQSGKGKHRFSAISKLIDKIGGPGVNPKIHAIEAVFSGTISKAAYIKQVGSKSEANRLANRGILKDDGITIDKAAENRGEGVDELEVKNEIINILGRFDFNEIKSYLESIANMDEMQDPREIAFENDPEFRAAMIAQREAEDAIDRLLYENIPDELYSDIIDIEYVEFSPEEIANFEEIYNALPNDADMQMILSVLPFDPEFEFINQQIENKVDEIRNEDANQGVDGEIVAGEEGDSNGEVNGDRQEVEDQDRVIDIIEENIESLIPSFFRGGKDDISETSRYASVKISENYDIVLDQNEQPPFYVIKDKKGNIVSDKEFKTKNSANDEALELLGGWEKMRSEMFEEYYQKVKLDGSNPEFVKTIENILDIEKPKVVDETDRVNRLEQATNQLAVEKRKQKELEKEVTQLNKDIVKNANENQPNLFGQAQPNLGLDDPAEQRRVLNERKLELDNQRVLVYELEKQIEDLRDLKNQAIIDFGIQPIDRERDIVLNTVFKRISEGTINADDAAIFLDTNSIEVTNEIYDKLREAEQKFIKKERGIQVGDVVTIKGRNGNIDVEGNYRGKTNDGKNVVVVNGMQGIYDDNDISELNQKQQVFDNPIEQEIVTHADTIRNKFRQEFTSKGIPPDQVDAAIALMDIRANNWAKEEVGRKPDDWYSQIADVRSEDFVPNEPISDIVEEFQVELPSIEAINYVQKGEGIYANRVRGTDVQTGKPVTINTLKNKEKAPYLGSRFGQDVEPSGNYVTQQEIENVSEMWTKGTLSFENPLVIDVDENSLVDWKRTLSNQYGNKKGKALTIALQEAGYDGIITRNTQNNELGEIIIFDDNKSYSENNYIQPKSIQQLQEENRMTQPKIPVSKVFLNDNTQPPREKVSRADKFFNENRTSELPKEIVNVSDIIPTQKNLTIDNLENTVDVQNTDESIVLLKHQGKYYVLDGHHRIANRILEGNTQIDANVYDSDISEDIELDTKKSEVARVERLEDFGEKIGGAKKDLSQKLAEITGSDIATKPLSKSFPEPNYKKLVEEGVITQEGAIFLKFFYQNIPSKPRKEYRIPQWTKQVQNGIDLFRQVIEADNTKDFDFVQKMMDSVIVSSTVKRDYRMFSETMKGLGFPDIDVKLGDFSIKQFESGFYTNNAGEKVKTEEKYTIVKGYSIVKDFATMEDAISGLGQILFSAADKKVGTKFDIYQDTRTKKFFVGKKGTKVIRIVDGFDTAKEAREFLKEQQESVQGIWDNMKNIPDERRNANRERIGIDWRNGRNISSEEFGQTFGFRGVEFGNWVNNQERQSHVNEAFDALMDLSSALGISPKALSLNGELGLAFGARGSGKALAHYEPGKVVINLTKKKGAGSLAHEWWHALDNYFSRNRGIKDSYLTESPRQRINRDGTMDESIRVEIINEFKNLMKTITGSKIKERSAVLDGPRSKQYWSTDIEMSARAFENYIIEKLGSTNHRNDYLANFKETGEWISDAGQNLNALENYPYPLTEESPVINEAFQSLFEAMHEDATGKLYQDDKGAVETLDDGRKVIIAMNAPDFSTMVHEIAHIFESELSSDEQQIVKEFGGSEPFARAFENYLREGNAPNQEIQSLFDKFKNWMTNIYRILKGSPIDVKITPEIRQIFDRLISDQTPQEIVGPIDNTAEQIVKIKEKINQLREVKKIKLRRLEIDPVLSNKILQLTNRLEEFDKELGIEEKANILAEMDQIASDMINEMIIMGDIVAVDKQTGKPCS